MANIFTWDSQDIDLKDCIKVKTNCQQNDTMVLQFKIYDYDTPVDLTNYNITFVAKKPDNTIYGQAESITKSSNLLTITCDSQLTSNTGRVISTVVITDNNGNRKGSYFIVFNVFGILNDEDRVVSKNFVDILNKFDEDVAIALSLETSFANNIETAQNIADDFAIKIPQATNIDNQLNNTINTGNTLESKLVNDITIGTPLNTKLETNIVMADTVKSELVLASASANSDKDELISTIANADTKLQEFKNYDTTELVPKSNTMLNEMYCTEELLTLNHGLNGYPIVKMTYTLYGAGIGGAGDFPAGADSQCNLMQDKMIYTDSNNVKILVPVDYYIANPQINKLNDYKYVITFTNSTRSILVELIKGSISQDIVAIYNTLSDSIFQTAQGTANEITLTIKGTLINGYSLTFIAGADNGGNATTINGKHLYKPNSVVSPKLITGKAYTVWYSSTGDCFFIKASATGIVTSEKVLAGETYSTEEDTDQIGTCPINGELNKFLNCGESFNIPLGYTEGGTITANSLASQTIATATSNKMLNGETAWVNGVELTGNIPSKTAQTYTPSTTQQIINANQYLSENQIILGDSNLIPSNIINGISLFGIVGSATPESMGGKYYKNGTVYIGTTRINIPLTFTPSIVIMKYTNTTNALWAQEIDIYLNGAVYMFGRNDSASSYGLYMETTNLTVTENNISFLPRICTNQTFEWYAIG